ncbi:MAG: NADH-quinone oxidoreductase subunit J [Chloroflexi bacterium]|nr:NADH-quinone oxidoreductase subunit J [Chloroflexota bacterium]
MTVDLILFFIVALVAITTALGMLLSRNAVYSALFLVLNFATVAVFYLLLAAPFIAITQVTVYAGAIMVLFLFVIMLLGADALPESKVLPWQKPLAVTLALILALESVYLLFIRQTAAGGIGAPNAEFGSPQAIGTMLFNQYLLPFEVTSILLLVAMVGAIVLTKKQKGGQG